MHHVDAGGGLRTVRESHCRVDDDEIARCIYWLLDHHARTRVASSRSPLYLPQRISCLTPGNAYPLETFMKLSCIWGQWSFINLFHRQTIATQKTHTSININKTKATTKSIKSNEARRAYSGDEVLAQDAASPLSTRKGVWGVL